MLGLPVDFVLPPIAMLTVDKLLAFDNVLFHLVYFNIGLALHHSMDLMLQPESLPCMPSVSEMEATMKTLLSWVSAQIPILKC